VTIVTDAVEAAICAPVGGGDIQVAVAAVLSSPSPSALSAATTTSAAAACPQRRRRIAAIFSAAIDAKLPARSVAAVAAPPGCG